MVASAPTRLLTVEDLLRLSDEPRCELIEGELVELSPAHKRHGVIQNRFARRLGRYFDAHPDLGDVWVGDTGFVVGDALDTVCIPDAAVLTPEQSAYGEVDETPEYMPFVPLIPVEIKSPSNTEAQIAKKLSLYLAAGAREVWWVRPTQRTVTVHRPDGVIEVLRIGDTLVTDALPGFRMELSDLFA